jgi:hypothetical protein
MNADELRSETSGVLLRTFALILDELRRREIVRSSNNPVADLAELVAAKTLGLQLVGKSSAGHDAVHPIDKTRYQVKARRHTPHNRSRQLSFIRGLDSKPFDYVVGILFDADFRVLRACMIPYDIVRKRAKFVSRVNAHRFLLRDEVWDEPTVRDLTEQMRVTAGELGCV